MRELIAESKAENLERLRIENCIDWQKFDYIPQK